ncbi:MAG: putative manganese transporter [Eubacteriales bacterium]|nr:putative manganese transporter [Eubacteriales bacterium]
MELFIDVILDAGIDTLKLLPFLFLTYLAMEYLESHTGEHTAQMLTRTRNAGPLIGGLLGMIPQCGFSSAASSLYSGGIITAGTLIAVFLSTSDEMLPILLSGNAPIPDILRILGLKVVFGIIFGFIVDVLLRFLRPKNPERHIHDLCEHDHCHCEEGSMLYSTLNHTLQVALFILIVNLVLGFLVEAIGMNRLITGFQSYPVLSIFITALIGLIPNCASSVAITTLYLQGVLSFGSMMAGLLACAGIGLVVLFRNNRRQRVNLAILGTLYVISVICGIFCNVIF